MRYLSLFSGVGGFELGIQRAYLHKLQDCTEPTTKDIRGQGNKPKSSRQQPGGRQTATCIGYSEIDKYAIATYERNFNGKCKKHIRPNEPGFPQRPANGDHATDEFQQWQCVDCRGYAHQNYGDATTINETELPDFDLLVGGFPCQAFSVAGKRHGFNDTRGTLFFDIARILAHKRPRHFLLENVKGLLSHDSGKTFQTILGVLTDLGYVVEWQVLNAKDFGVPQNRERVFIIGHLGGECARQVFPIGGVVKENYRRRATATAINNASRGYEARKEPIANAIRAGEMGSKNIIYSKTIRGGGRKSPHSSKQNWDSYEVNGKIRRLTPTECERLMSWPDNWTIGSDTQRYKQCGNGVVSNVVQAVIENMKGCLR